MKSLWGTIIGGIVLVAATYMVLKYNSGVNQVTNSTVHAVGKIESNFMTAP